MADLHRDRFEECFRATIHSLVPGNHGPEFYLKMLIAAVDEQDIDTRGAILESLELVIEEEIR